MSESTALTVPGLRLRNPLTGRHSWLSLAADGTFSQSQVNSDESHVPALLTPNPVVASQPTIFGGLVAGRWYSITIGFDGFLANGSTVALQSGSGQLYGSPYVGSGATAWAMTFYYMPQPDDILRFTVYSRNWTGSAVRRWSPLTASAGPQILYSSPYYFYNGVATWATVGFTKPVSTVSELYPADANGLAAGTLQSFSLSGDGMSAVILITIGATATALRIVNANGVDGSYTWYHDLPITRLVSVKASLADVKTPAGVAIVAGTPVDITFTFGEQLAAFGPTIIAGGGAITNLVFAAPSNSAIVTYTPGQPGTQTLEIFTRDHLDGSEGTITHSFTALGPPAIVAGSISPSQFVDAWPAETTLLFDKAIASIGSVALVDLAGAAAGEVSGVTVNGTMVTFTTTAAPTSNRLVFTNVVAADSTSAASLSAPITRQAPTSPLLNSAVKDTSVLADFVTGSRTTVTFTFSDPLQTFTPSISAGGGTLGTISFTAPSTTASIEITPGPTPGLNSVSIYIRDNIDGGSDTVSYSFTARAPVLATIVGVEPANLSVAIATDVVVSFSEPIASVPVGGISLTGVGTLDTARFSFPYLGDNTKARIGITSTSVTGVTFGGIIDVNESATASPSASLSTGPPQPLYYLDASDESAFTYDATTKVISAINTPGLAYSNVGGAWIAGGLNGKGVIDFAGSPAVIRCAEQTQFNGGSWTISILLRAKGGDTEGGGGTLNVPTSTVWDPIRLDYVYTGQPFRFAWQVPLSGWEAAATTRTITLGNWYLFTISKQAGSADTRYYVDDVYVGSSGTTYGDMSYFIINSGSRTGFANGNRTAFAEVRIYNQALNAAAVATLHDTVKTKWGLGVTM